MDKDKQEGKLYEWKKEIILAQLLSIETSIEKLEKLNKEGKKIFDDIIISFYDIQCLNEEKDDMLGLFNSLDLKLCVKIVIQNQKRLNQVEQIHQKMKKFMGMIEENFVNLQKVLDDCFGGDTLNKKQQVLDYLLLQYPNILSIQIILNLLLVLVPQLREDIQTKQQLLEEINEFLQDNTTDQGLLQIDHESIKTFKYYIYIWTFRPSVDETNEKALNKALTAYYQDFEPK
ncbi:hypothetical protein TTHERM_00895670 (macronuclear) [Tetrahymena thermophila SB210]|uniref:Uncharacterized protein n=1 Tax=Tetrahymena thermophila (strain SB210) TaxID=312017 RepID=Q22E60_TETTS|nr:hypothetical protein TTHERM_00895670 [Tetrahymena thermophila SB210]EAR83554.2 hypothetical protein TTHERM_00895670 [Tetrahymena thermophila SB210]|eukprot:XP_001031217.2 hypothetical protein TTHERM_00895670 [Tetrahymena thermophila SB210]